MKWTKKDTIETITSILVSVATAVFVTKFMH